jgi:hypothetical protein
LPSCITYFSVVGQISGINNCDEWVAERSHAWQMEEITYYWNCDGSCTLASLLFGSLKISGI